MVINAQRTIYGIDLHLASSLGQPYTVIVNTTLNEKFNVLPKNGVIKEYPTIKYLAIGIGGNNVVENVSDYTYSEHNPMDGALFEHIPFVMRAKNNDLSADEAKKYRLRKIEIFNNIEYYCYYLKEIEKIKYDANFYKISFVGDTPTLSILNTDTATILSPKPSSRSTSPDTLKSATYVTKIAKILFSLSTWEQDEIANVLMLRKKSDRSITEIGICGGIDTTVNGYTEASYVQIYYHAGIDIKTLLEAKAGAIEKYIELGGGEPLLQC